jgi:hypothetical protein
MAAEVLPTLSVSGMSGSKGGYRGVGYEKVSALFETQSLPALLRSNSPAEGSIQATSPAMCNGLRCRVAAPSTRKRSSILHSDSKQDPLDLFEFTQPPSSRGASWKRPFGKLLGFEAEAALTNLTFRAQNISSCATRVLYTNGLISILHPVVLRPGERAEADGIGIDLARRRLHLTNATGSLTPHAVAKAIGPITYRDVSPYLFDVPPQAHVEGSVPLGRSD